MRTRRGQNTRRSRRARIGGEDGYADSADRCLVLRLYVLPSDPHVWLVSQGYWAPIVLCMLSGYSGWPCDSFARFSALCTLPFVRLFLTRRASLLLVLFVSCLLLFIFSHNQLVCLLRDVSIPACIHACMRGSRYRMVQVAQTEPTNTRRTKE
jgi:hypothetical protein